MIELPAVEPNETQGEYVGRLLRNNIITYNQIRLAIEKYNKK